MESLDSIQLEEIYEARDRISSLIVRTPLIRLDVEDTPAEIYLKLENLQRVGSFKPRGAINVLSTVSKRQLEKGVYTASSGNMALALAWYSRQLGISCSSVVRETTPDAKLNPIRQYGGKAVKVSDEEWWQVIISHKSERLDGYFIHPVCNPAVIAGHGTIGLEILEDLPEVDAVIMPYGGGGLSSGISTAIRALKPDTKCYACEVETAAPVAAALAAGEPREIKRRPNPLGCVGAKSVLPSMWPLVSKLLDDSLVVTIDEVAEALRLLIEHNHVVAEGSGAMPVAAALTGKAGSGKLVCVVSGGNIDTDQLVQLLSGKIPEIPKN